MFNDNQTNTVYFASCLLDRYPSILSDAITFLEENEIAVRFINDTKNIWCRDYMPIQVGDHFIKFGYADSNHKHRKRPSILCYRQFDPIPSQIKLDGGNIIRHSDKAVLTEKVIRDNPGLKIDKLENLLEAEIILIPVEPYDDLGHSDGILSFVSDSTILINDYESQPQKYWKRYQDKLIKCFKDYCIKTLPYAFDQTPKITEKQFRKRFPFADDFGPGFGYYMNFLMVGDVILLPKFYIEKDEAALTKMRELYPSYRVKQIDCSQLSMEGGLIHCVSWNIKQSSYTCR